MQNFLILLLVSVLHAPVIYAGLTDEVRIYMHEEGSDVFTGNYGAAIKEKYCGNGPLKTLAEYPDDFCYYKAMTERCNEHDACMIQCRMTGDGEYTGGGCPHLCWHVKPKHWKALKIEEGCDAQYTGGRLHR